MRNILIISSDFDEIISQVVDLRYENLFYFSQYKSFLENISLKSQKITLPLIYSIKMASQADNRSIKSILKRKKLSKEDKKAINHFVKENNGFEYAKNVMLEYKKKALKILETFQDNQSKNSLKILLDYIIDRKY